MRCVPGLLYVGLTVNDLADTEIIWQRELTIPCQPADFTGQVETQSLKRVKAKKAGYIYLLLGNNTCWYKIGKSKTPEIRNNQIGTKMPFKCETIVTHKVSDMVSAETFWHNYFSEKRTNGEWFTLSPADVDLFVYHFSEVYQGQLP